MTDPINVKNIGGFKSLNDFFAFHNCICSTKSIKITLGEGIEGLARGLRCIDIQSQRTGETKRCGGLEDNVIVGGWDHAILDTKTYCAGIFAGRQNTMEVQGAGWSTMSAIIAGSDNTMSNKRSVILAGRYNIIRGNNEEYGYNVCGGSDNWITYGSFNICHGRANHVNSHKWCAIFGQGGITLANNDFIMAGGIGDRTSVSNHFRIAGDTNDVIIGRAVDQEDTSKTNILRLQTSNPNNQSKYVGFRAMADLASSDVYQIGIGEAGTEKQTPTIVNAWIPIKIGATKYYCPLYTSQTD